MTFDFEKIAWLVAVLVTWIGLFFLCSAVYWQIYKKKGSSKTIHKGKVVDGLSFPEEAFFVSPSFNNREVLKAKNKLRIHDAFGSDGLANWRHFHPYPSLGSSSEADNFIREASNAMLFGKNAVELVEKDFVELRKVKFRINKPADIFEYFKATFHYNYAVKWQDQKKSEDPQEMQSWVTLTPPRYVEFSEKLEARLAATFKHGFGGYLFELSLHLVSIANEFQPSIDDKGFKEKFYGTILARLAGHGTTDLSFEEIAAQMAYRDFLYYSLAVGTGNLPSEISAAAGMPRLVTSLHLLLSYILLGLFVGILSGIFGG